MSSFTCFFFFFFFWLFEIAGRVNFAASRTSNEDATVRGWGLGARRSCRSAGINDDALRLRLQPPGRRRTLLHRLTGRIGRTRRGRRQKVFLSQHSRHCFHIQLFNKKKFQSNAISRLFHSLFKYETQWGISLQNENITKILSKLHRIVRFKNNLIWLNFETEFELFH